MDILPNYQIQFDDANEQIILHFGKERSFLVVLPWLLLGLGGFCWIMDVCPYEPPTHPYWMILSRIIAIVSIPVFILREYFIDDVFIDKKRKGIFRKISVKGFSKELFFIPFEKIFGLGFHGYKIKIGINYTLVAVLKDGRFLELSHGFPPLKFQEKIGEAKKMSQFSGCSFPLPTKEYPYLFLEGEGQKMKICYKKIPCLDPGVVSMVAIGILGGVLKALFPHVWIGMLMVIVVVVWIIYSSVSAIIEKKKWV